MILRLVVRSIVGLALIAGGTAQTPLPVALPVAVPIPTPVPSRKPLPIITPMPTPTPGPTPTPRREPALLVEAFVVGGAYGVFSTRDVMSIWIEVLMIDAPPPPIAIGDAVANVGLRIYRADGSPVVRSNVPSVPAQIENTSSLGSEEPLSAWGYGALPLGRYRFEVEPARRLVDWAAAVHVAVRTNGPLDVDVVANYEDVEREYVPRPDGWNSGNPCGRHVVTRTFRPPALSAYHAVDGGIECFTASITAASVRDAVLIERNFATSDGNRLASERVGVTCGPDRIVRLAYDSQGPPASVVEVQIAPLTTGSIVVRYSRPRGLPPDPAAEAALRAPCSMR